MAQLFSAKLIINKKNHILYPSTGQGIGRDSTEFHPRNFHYAENIYILLISIKICNNYY